jgi:hypothetical protein
MGQAAAVRLVENRPDKGKHWRTRRDSNWCGAINRKRGREVEYCRNNSSGLLLGCRIRQHKLQRFKRAWWTTAWRDRMRGMWAGAPAKFRHSHRRDRPGLWNYWCDRRSPDSFVDQSWLSGK